MAFSNGSRRRGIVAEINVTPLTDVFLVLLISFMITTSAMMNAARRRPAAVERRGAGAEGRHGHDDAVARDS